jgi:hypothetical protein
MLRHAYFCDELMRNFGVMDFTPSDLKIDRMSMRIGDNMKLGGSSSTGFSNSTFFSTPSSTRMLMSADVTSIGEYPPHVTSKCSIAAR